MPKTLTATDRSALIRLASTMEAGDPKRRAILAGLSKISKRNDRENVFWIVTPPDPRTQNTPRAEINSGWPDKENAEEYASYPDLARAKAKVYDKSGLQRLGLNPDNDGDWENMFDRNNRAH